MARKKKPAKSSRRQPEIGNISQFSPKGPRKTFVIGEGEYPLFLRDSFDAELLFRGDYKQMDALISGGYHRGYVSTYDFKNIEVLFEEMKNRLRISSRRRESKIHSTAESSILQNVEFPKSETQGDVIMYFKKKHKKTSLDTYGAEIQKEVQNVFRDICNLRAYLYMDLIVGIICYYVGHYKKDFAGD